LSRMDRAAFIVCACSAFHCKETAAVLPLLVLVDAWALGRPSRQLSFDCGGLVAVFGSIGVARLVMASAVVRQPLTKYLVQRWIFGTVGGLVVPWHAAVIETAPAIPLAGCLVVVALSAAYFLGPSSRTRLKGALCTSCWPLVATLPTIAFFFITPDLQGSRYLYLASIGYALVLLRMTAAHRQPVAATLASVAIGTVVATGALGVRMHQRAWLSASRTRDAVQHAAVSNRAMQACGTIAVDDLPDSVSGAYVLRNGAIPAMASTTGLTVQAVASRGCSFRWDATSAAFVPK
jgi:hypothetical protein